MPERQYVLGLAYQAGRDARIVKGMDGGRDFFTPDELEKACWSFLPGGADVGLFHGPDDTIGHFTVTESYIYRGPDWPQENGTVIKAGDWLIGGICDDIAWRLVKSGRVNGFSPQGAARRITPRDPGS
ncbi:XkdF-like putative serine protease domain-containing protein [Kitasatospora sp. NPDC094028]